MYIYIRLSFISLYDGCNDEKDYHRIVLTNLCSLGIVDKMMLRRAHSPHLDLDHAFKRVPRL